MYANLILLEKNEKYKFWILVKDMKVGAHGGKMCWLLKLCWNES